MFDNKKQDFKEDGSVPSHKVDEHKAGTSLPAGVPKIKAQPIDPSEVSGTKEKRIEFLKAKSDRTLEEGLELQELELGLEKSKEINAGVTSDDVHNQQVQLRNAEKAEPKV